MSVHTLLTRYSLTARSEGLSDKTVSHVRRAVGFFDQFIGGINDASKVTADDLRRFILAMQLKPRWAGQHQQNGQRISPTSINTYTRAIKSFWSWLKREGIIKNNPLTMVAAPKIPKRLPKTLTEQELTAVLKVVKGNWRDRAIIELLLDSGMRLSELTGLTRDDALIGDGVVKVFGKGSKERHVYITKETELSINCYCIFARPEPVGEDKLFLNVDGYPLTNDRVQKILDRIGKKANISVRLSPHKLRHTYTTLSLKHGANLEYVRLTLGHTDIKATEVYLSVADADVAEAHKKFSPVANLPKAKR